MEETTDSSKKKKGMSWNWLLSKGPFLPLESIMAQDLRQLEESIQK